MDDQYIESAALGDLHAAADDEITKNLGLKTSRLDGAYLSCASSLPPSAIVINRAIGLGDEAIAQTEDIKRVQSFYAEAGVEKYFLHRNTHAHPESLPELLEKAGFKKARGWMKFSRDTDIPPEVETDLRLVLVGPEQGIQFGEIVCECFDLGNIAVPWLAKLPGRDPWRIYLTFSGDIAVGAGAMFMQNRVAWLDWCATLPQYRGQGSQRAIIRHGIQDAIDLGCDEIMTCTGEAVPGDPQHSYSNMLKMGFVERYVRENYILDI